MLDAFIQWLLDLFRGMGYPGIVVLMAVESSILPLPSELVMPPAGYLAAKGEMSFVLAVACGVLGSILGALANYGLAHWLGRAFFLRLGKYVLITERALDRSERYFAAHGEISLFLGRMLPVVRYLISIPAGIARMHLGRFVVFTGLGALVWCTILTWIGWFIGSREDVILEVLNQEARRYAGRAVLVALPVLAGIAAVYIWWYRRRASAQGRQGEEGRVAAQRFLVPGHVQGVGFRWWVWRQATRLGVHGLARNLRDGSVEVIAEGSDSVLAELERLLGQGPPAAEVERVEKSQVPHEVPIV